MWWQLSCKVPPISITRQHLVYFNVICWWLTWWHLSCELPHISVSRQHLLYFSSIYRWLVWWLHFTIRPFDLWPPGISLEVLVPQVVVGNLVDQTAMVKWQPKTAGILPVKYPIHQNTCGTIIEKHHKDLFYLYQHGKLIRSNLDISIHLKRLFIFYFTSFHH